MDTEELIRLLKTCKERFCKEDEEWKKGCKRNIFIHHPDKGGEEENFKELNNCNAMVKDLEAAERARAEAAERARAEAAEWEDVAEFPWSEETQIDDTGTASEYSDSDGEYAHESTATSPSRRIGRVETSPKPRLQNSTSPNMTRIFNKIPGTMKYRVDRSASRKRKVETKVQLEETKEDTKREIRRREVNEVIRLNNERAAARERERRRALDERESRAEVSQNCCWTLTFI